MNIKSDSKELIRDLSKSIIHLQRIGSDIYGLSNEDSDEDYLNIYIDTDENYRSFLWEHNQIQFKFKNADVNYVELGLFVRNILSGDSTVSFEILFSNDLLKNEKLSWITDFKMDFASYKIIKSYLGLAKRDLKEAKSISNNFEKINKRTRNKLSHAIRGLIFAEMLINNDFKLILNEKRSTTNKTNLSDLKFISYVKEGILDNKLSEIYKNVELGINKSRIELNDKLNKNEIKQYMSKERLMELDNLVKQTILKNKPNHNIDYGDMFYKTMTEGLNYKQTLDTTSTDTYT